jgi:shikimate kinase
MSVTRPIALIGLPGSGKSVVAATLAEQMGGAAIDLDHEVAASAGRAIAQIFAVEGEPGFRRRESEQLRAALDRSPVVVACGGGVVLDPRHRQWLRARCRVVWLQVSPAEAERRIGAAASERPLLQGGSVEERLQTLLDERHLLYAEVAELCVATDGRSPVEIADSVLRGLGLSAAKRSA